MFSGTHTTIFVVVALAATLVLPAPAAGTSGAVPATVDVDQEATADVLDVGSVQANNSSLTPARVVSLIEDGRAGDRADDVTTWLQGNASELDDEQAATAYRWLLARGASATGSVDGAALHAVAEQLPDDRAADVVADVRDRLPSEDVARLRDRLDGVGAGWSLDVAGWLQGTDPATSTTTATTTQPTPTTTETASTSTPTNAASGADPTGEYGNASYGVVEAVRTDIAANSTAMMASLKPGLFVESVEWRDGFALVTVVNSRPRAEQLVFADRNDWDPSAESSTIDREAVTVPTGRFTVKVPASVERGEQAISVDPGLDGKLVGLASGDGGAAPDPFRGSSGTEGWLFGALTVAAGVLAGGAWVMTGESGEPRPARPGA